MQDGVNVPNRQSPQWRPRAENDLVAIADYIAIDNPDAAEGLKNLIVKKANSLPGNPKAYRPGRVEGTREMVVHPNYLVIYQETPAGITILRVLHAAQRWP